MFPVWCWTMPAPPYWAISPKISVSQYSRLRWWMRMWESAPLSESSTRRICKRRILSGAAQPQVLCWTFFPPVCGMASRSVWREQPALEKPQWPAGCSPRSPTISASSPLKMAPVSWIWCERKMAGSPIVSFTPSPVSRRMPSRAWIRICCWTWPCGIIPTLSVWEKCVQRRHTQRRKRPAPVTVY